MTTYDVEFYLKTKDEKGRTKIEFAGTVEVTMLPGDKMPVAAKAFRQASSRQQQAYRVVVTPRRGVA
jgi:hypothetical protein